MFENLTAKLHETFKNLTGRGSLTATNVEDAMREVRLALLDADVNFKIVKEFVETVKEQCLGEKVLKSVTPGQQFIKIVNDELTRLLGQANAPLDLTGSPATLMLVGLHGSGKTTTAGKLAKHLTEKGRRVLLVAADVYRPAAIDQLETLAKQLKIKVYSNRETKDVVAIAEAARTYARHENCDTMILDTAGRLQIDTDLVQELVRLRAAATPSEVLLVADAAIGQEAVSVATHFNDAVKLTGIVLTKLDGDARGGAALSMRQVTGCPIKFVGMGEKLDDLEPFYPERMASRVLGMGDVVSLVEKAAAQISEEEAKELEQKMLKKQFDLNDFLNQLRQLEKLGGMRKVLDFIPGGNNLLQGAEVDESVLRHIEGVILSMTPYERSHPEVLGLQSRRERVAKGSGRSMVEVTQLLKRFEMMRDMMSKWGKMAKAMGSGASPGAGQAAMAPGGRGGGPARLLSQKEKKARRKKNKR